MTKLCMPGRGGNEARCPGPGGPGSTMISLFKHGWATFTGQRIKKPEGTRSLLLFCVDVYVTRLRASMGWMDGQYPGMIRTFGPKAESARFPLF